MYTRHFDSVKKLVICCFIQVANAVTGILLILPACKIRSSRDTAMHVKGDFCLRILADVTAQHNGCLLCMAIGLLEPFVIVNGTILLIGSEFVMH
ncbi:hypothetical protein J3F84DRAFT_214252 [Trichoderma pleuroticola]